MTITKTITKTKIKTMKKTFVSLAIVAGVFGALLLFNPSEGSIVIMRLIGIALMAEGVMNLATVLTAVKIIKHQKKDVLEGVYREL